MKIILPDPALVVLIGASAAGKSTFAQRHFRPTEVLSSDRCRAWVSDDANDQSASTDAFAVLHHIAEARLSRGLTTVIDATNVQAMARAPLLALARQFRLPPIAIVLIVPEATCGERNHSRAERNLDPEIIRTHLNQLRETVGDPPSPAMLEREGFQEVHLLIGVAEIEAASVVRERRQDIGAEVHGY